MARAAKPKVSRRDTNHGMEVRSHHTVLTQTIQRSGGRLEPMPAQATFEGCMSKMAPSCADCQFVFMLTRHERTVPNARAILKEALAAGVRQIGFKDVGLAPFGWRLWEVSR